MKKFVPVICILISIFFLHNSAQAQSPTGDSLPTYKIAIFAPLYIDSVFAESNYKYGKKFPKFIMPGLDFVQGAQIALDSLPLMNGNIAAQIFDSKATVANVSYLIASGKLDSFKLIIGAVKDDDVQQLSAFAKQKNIPFISATSPNDAGVTQNPFLVIMNSTLKSHCEAIYNHLLQSHRSDKIFLVRKPGIQENRIQDYFTNMNAPDGKPLLNIQTINISEDFSVIKAKLDSNLKTTIIGGSLNEIFAFNLVSVAAKLDETYPITLFGMPNWDVFPSLNKKKNIKNLSIYYTTPYYKNKWDRNCQMIQSVYLKKYKSNPSDMTYKGFESVYLFSRLLTKYPNDFMSHLNELSYKVFTDYNFKPVYLSTNTLVPDYIENKHLYFIKMVNGSFTKAW